MPHSNYHRPWYNSVKEGDKEEDVAGLPPPSPPQTQPSRKSSWSQTGPRISCSRKRRLPETLFRRTLERFLPKPCDPFAGNKIIREAVFPEIAQLLNDYGEPEWSLRPRTFAILWVLGIPEKLNDFIREGRNDYAIPYNQGNLPDAIRGSALRARFLQLQLAVRGRQDDVMELEGCGRHLYLNGNADVYFYSMRTLGSGRFAKVDEVRSWQTTKTYARKQILRGDSVFEDQGQLRAFEKEIKSLKKLRHHHVVQLVGSYTDATSLGLIMSPVADMDLHEYLQSTTVNPHHRKRMLRSYFGCLATSLAYIHSQSIRHKDIKPSNILVKDDRVLLSDFGTSRTCLDGHLTTNGVPRDGTPRYWAPEVGDGADRNTASDVWSLGCVFLEMATILFGYSHYDLLSFFSKNGTENYTRISLNEEAIKLWISHLGETSPGVDAEILEWTSLMLQQDQAERLTAAQLRGRILDCQADHDYICSHCSSKNSDTPPPVDGNELLHVYNTAPLQKSLPSTNSNSDITPIEDETRSPTPSPSESKKDSSSSSRQPTSLTEDNAQDIVKKSDPIKENQRQENTKPSKAVRFKDTTHSSSANVIRTEAAHSLLPRFEGLPLDRRPEATTRKPQEKDRDEEAEFIIPDPVTPPPLYRRDVMPLPRATVVPSYILAGANRFSRHDIIEQGLHGHNNIVNVFVYGRLMFPSVLHSLAKTSISGAYAPNLQRRIFPQPEDWRQANSSIQRTSEIMTPAVLRGYDRWQPSDLDCAVIQRASSTPDILERRERAGGYETIHPKGEVVGFLIMGVEMEVVRWLDLLFTSDEKSLQELTPVKRGEGTSFSSYSDMSSSPLRRELVTVEVEVGNSKNGDEMYPVEAYTYVWKHGGNNLWTPWSEDCFVRLCKFQGMVLKDKQVVEAEEALAKTMKISFALIGDFLCGVVVTGQVEALRRLLDKGCDPDAPCHFYGTALQAAVCMGNDAMVKILLDRGADVNARSERYGTALIAAAFSSRKAITRTLLSRGADVFATHEIHVNALYQAVGHSDYAIAEALLEHAAWLVEDWAEIVDLATEIGDAEITDLLARYDVRQLHLLKLQTRARGHLEYDDVVGESRHRTYTAIISAIVRKGVAVQATSGNWKGRKGVAVVVAALNAGVSPDILPLLRNAVNPVRVLVERMKQSDALAEQQPYDGRRLRDPRERGDDKKRERERTSGSREYERSNRPRRRLEDSTRERNVMLDKPAPCRQRPRDAGGTASEPPRRRQGDNQTTPRSRVKPKAIRVKRSDERDGNRDRQI